MARKALVEYFAAPNKDVLHERGFRAAASRLDGQIRNSRAQRDMRLINQRKVAQCETRLQNATPRSLSSFGLVAPAKNDRFWSRRNAPLLLPDSARSTT